MAVSVRSPKDFWMGVLYAVVGVAALVIARSYSFGSAARMGPGFLPTIVSILLIVVGALSVLRSLRTDGEGIEAPRLLPILLILSAIGAFGILVERAGFFISGLLLLLVSAKASQYFRLDVRILLGAVALVSLSALLFIKVLGVSMPLLGLWFDSF